MPPKEPSDRQITRGLLDYEIVQRRSGRARHQKAWTDESHSLSHLGGFVPGVGPGCERSVAGARRVGV